MKQISNHKKKYYSEKIYYNYICMNQLKNRELKKYNIYNAYIF